MKLIFMCIVVTFIMIQLSFGLPQIPSDAEEWDSWKSFKQLYDKSYNSKDEELKR
jgi:hypothetical protein